MSPDRREVDEVVAGLSIAWAGLGLQRDVKDLVWVGVGLDRNVKDLGRVGLGYDRDV